MTTALVGLLFSFTYCSDITSANDNWFAPFKWREVGPSATGGRVTDIEVDPNDDHHIFVASASGGLWETTNNGTTWKCIFENEGTISIGDIALDANEPKTLWVGTGEANNQRSSLWGDGIYKSTDGGKSWANMGLKDTHHIGRVVIDPRDSNIVYVAALGHLYSANEQRGLFKTTDGGSTWEKVLYLSSEVGVVDIALDPLQPDTILAASYERLRRAWDFDGAGPGSAIYKSTDGGKNWNRLTNGLPSGEIGRIGLEVYSKNPQIVYATVSNQNLAEPGSRSSSGRPPVNNAPGKVRVQDEQGDEDEDEDDETSIETQWGISFQIQDDGIFVSQVRRGSSAQRQGLADGDQLISVGGVSTENLEQLKAVVESIKPGDRIRLVVKKDGAETKVLLTAPSKPPRRTIGGEIYRSQDGGESWKKVNRRTTGGTPAYYYGQIRIDPEDDQRVYLLSVPLHVSDDGGVNFKSNGAPSVHVDHHALWINPKNPNHLMLGNDGGFHISYDRAKSWDYVFNLPLAQFYAIAVDMQQPYHVYGGLQDNGSWGGPSRSSGSGVGRDQWYRVGGGDGFYVQVDPEDSNIVFSESQFGAISRFDRKTGARKSIRPPQNETSPNRYNWNAPILMSRHDSRVIYFGGNRLFKSYNRGDDWLEISGDLTTAAADKISGNVPHCTITTIAESRLDKDLLMVGTDDGKVQVTRDGGKVWTDVSTNFPVQPATWWCSRIELSHHDPSSAFVSFTGYREDDIRAFVFKTTDLGANWSSIAGNLPAEPVNVIKQDQKNPSTLYVGTEFGVYVSLNSGANWTSLNQQLPRVSVQDLLVHSRDRDLVIGTHGRGIFVLDDITPFQEFDPVVELQPGHLFSVRDWQPIPRSGRGGFAGDRHWTPPNPATGVTLWYQLNADMENDEATLVVQDDQGKEVAKLRIKNEAGLHRVSFPQSRSGRQAGGGQAGGRGQRRFRGGSQVAKPGRYKAVLQIGDEKFEREFRILEP